MKKLLYISILTLLSVSGAAAQHLSRQQLRNCYLQSLQRRTALDSFMAQLQNIATPTSVEESYLGICNGMKAQYADGTWSKIKLVQKSKSLLNEAIKRDSRDPELRFMRFTLEHYLPTFLGMSGDMRDDLATIFTDKGFLNDNADLKKMALGFIADTKRCTPDQQKLLESSLIELNHGSIAQK